ETGQAKRLVEQSLALYQKVEDMVGCASALYRLGKLARVQGDHERAIRHSTESLALARGLGDRDCYAAALYTMGHVAFQQREFGRATALFTESLGLRRALESRLGVADCLAGLAEVGVAAGQLESAARTLGWLESHLDTTNLYLDP